MGDSLLYRDNRALIILSQLDEYKIILEKVKEGLENFTERQIRLIGNDDSTRTIILSTRYFDRGFYENYFTDLVSEYVIPYITVHDFPFLFIPNDTKNIYLSKERPIQCFLFQFQDGNLFPDEIELWDDDEQKDE
jgi:hypothetical protein